MERTNQNSSHAGCHGQTQLARAHGLRAFIATLLSAALLYAHPRTTSADVVTLYPAKDNTVLQDPGSESSNGVGDGIFSGRTGINGGGWIQRAVIEFDIAAAIPAGSTITSAALTLDLLKTSSGNQNHTLYRLLSEWGEGTSNGSGGQGAAATPGDVTWLHTFYPDQFWPVPGGHYVATSSASKIIGSALVAYTWPSTPQTVADVQGWLDAPQDNHGWMVRGNEAVLKTSKKFASGENETTLKWPRLVINFTPPPPPPCDADVVPAQGDGEVNIDDLFGIIDAWDTADPQFDIAPPGDPNGLVDIDDLFVVIGDWGTCE